MNELVTFTFVLLSCFLLPIIISCAICLHLICQKKRWFQNKVSIQEEGNVELGSTISNLELQMERQAKQKEDEKRLAQIMAAERCIKTNIILGALLVLIFFISLVLSKEARVYFSIIIFSIFKAVLPLLTTIVNFGTIQYVTKQYWIHFNRCCVSS